MSEMLKSSSAMGAATLASRILGVVRESLYARFMGDSVVAGAFNMAFLIPNLFRRLLGEGALTAAFIPIFKDKERNEGEEKMWRAANEVISGLIVSASVIIALVLLGISIALYLNGPSLPAIPEPGAETLAVRGLTWLSPGTHLMFRLLRVMFPYMLFICLTAIFMGMLNARGHFFVPAMGATVMNVTMILCVLFVAPIWGERLEEKIFALAWAVLIAGAAQAAYQIPSLLREGFRWRWESPMNSDTVREVLARMVPGMLGVAAFQLNVLFTQGIAFRVDEQIVASFGYAVRLMELPQGIFGISMATYLLPTLSGLAADKKYPEFRVTLKQALSHVYFANLLATVLLIVLSVPIIRFLFERGEFTATSTNRAAFALACLSPGLIAFSTVNILARSFYALGDMKTPMRISIFCLGMNVFLTIWLIEPFRQGGLGIANSISSMVNAALLFYALKRKLKYLQFGEIRSLMVKLGTAAAISGVVAWAAYRLWEHFVGHGNIWTRACEVFVPMIAAATVYFIVLRLWKVSQAEEYWTLIAGKLKRGPRE